jgi:Ca2+-binding EF-hand superfamily protein
MNLKTNRIMFDPFIELICSFCMKNIEKKVARFFKFVDDDNNGGVSYDEVANLCMRSFESMRGEEENPESVKFYADLADYFTRFIFTLTSVDHKEMITPEQLM